jgi:hypothetical protein
MPESTPPRGQAVKLALDKHALRKLIAEANLAPSFYNAQPARWHFAADGTVQLYEDLQRRLPVADPTGRLARMGVGAAFEGLNIALSKSGLSLRVLRLAQPGDEPDTDKPSLRLVASALINQGAARDVLAAYVYERHTFRGEFEPVNPEARDALAGLMRHLGDVDAIVESEDIQDLAQRYQHYHEEQMQRTAYQAEFYRWMRWTQREAQRRHDGLNIRDMAPTRLPRITKALLLRSLVRMTLESLGVVPEMYDETRSIASACAIGVLTGARDEDAFVSGQRFYRVWLEICRAGYALCPMTSATATDEGLSTLRERFKIPHDRQITSLFRVGKVAAGTLYHRQRLSVRELLI